MTWRAPVQLVVDDVASAEDDVAQALPPGLRMPQPKKPGAETRVVVALRPALSRNLVFTSASSEYFCSLV